MPCCRTQRAQEKYGAKTVSAVPIDRKACIFGVECGHWRDVAACRLMAAVALGRADLRRNECSIVISHLRFDRLWLRSSNRPGAAESLPVGCVIVSKS